MDNQNEAVPIEEQVAADWPIDINEIKDVEFSTNKECENFLYDWALEQGFSLIKETTKPYAIYLKCSRGGRQRKFVEAEAKRNKASKKIGNLFL